MFFISLQLLFSVKMLKRKRKKCFVEEKKCRYNFKTFNLVKLKKIVHAGYKKTYLLLLKKVKYVDTYLFDISVCMYIYIYIKKRFLKPIDS